MNTLQVQAQIECVVGSSPRKQGMYVAGTGRQIARPESLRDHQPGIVIVMNPAYKSELQQMVKKPGLAVQVESAWAETEP